MLLKPHQIPLKWLLFLVQLQLRGTLAITIQPSKELSLGHRSRHGCSPPPLSSVAIARATLKTKAGECVVAGTHSVLACHARKMKNDEEVEIFLKKEQSERNFSLFVFLCFHNSILVNWLLNLWTFKKPIWHKCLVIILSHEVYMFTFFVTSGKFDKILESTKIVLKYWIFPHRKKWTLYCKM